MPFNMMAGKILQWKKKTYFEEIYPRDFKICHVALLNFQSDELDEIDPSCLIHSRAVRFVFKELKTIDKDNPQRQI